MEIMKFLKRKIMLMVNNMTQNHLVNVGEEEAKTKRLKSNVFLPEELIAEIISFLSINTIVQLKCVSKSWNILISDPIFVEKHLSKSSQNPRLMLATPTTKYTYRRYSIESFPVRCLLENLLSTVSDDNFHGWWNTVGVVGTCNGLVCLLLTNYFVLWNPAMRTISKELGTSQENNILSAVFKFSFGCDSLTGTYKVVAHRVEKDEENEGSRRSQVRLFSIGDNCWRDIKSFPLIPINPNHNGVHLSGTVNWLALSDYHHSFNDYKDITSVQQFVIVSLNLSTETYTQFLLPSGFDEVPCYQPILQVLSDCLCFSHDFKVTEFVIWQMKEFGVQESWTQLFRIEYSLQMDTLLPFPFLLKKEFIEDANYRNTPLLPLYLSKNGDTLILATKGNRAIIYNRGDKNVERIRISNKLWWFSSMNYVESLVSPSWMTRISDSEVVKITVHEDSSEEDEDEDEVY